MPSPRTSKSLDSKNVALLHLLAAGVLNEWNLLVAVDLILLDIVPTEAADGLDGVRLAFDLDFVALHDFLDRATYVAHACVDSGFLYNPHH
jgi:hypothetical protein